MIEFITFLAKVITWAFDAYELAIIIYVLMSWFPGAYNTPVGHFLSKICQPYLAFFDRFIPAIGGISFSPIIAIIALSFIQNGVMGLLTTLIRLYVGG
ncbi:YggT family protein [Dellaglioa sp. P0083]|uniref:YggT family protein n=1 Tax=Dellaglioa kimchii TaxID=3344667 RepID=UPI0038D40C6B